MVANSITAKLPTLAVAGRSREPPVCLPAGKVGRTDWDSTLLQREKLRGDQCWTSYFPLRLHRSKALFTVLESLVLGRIYHLYFRYYGVVTLWQCARILLESCEPDLK